MRCSTRACYDHFNAFLFCIACIIDHFPRSPVCRNNLDSMENIKLVEEILCIFHHSQVRVAAHDDSYQWFQDDFAPLCTSRIALRAFLALVRATSRVPPIAVMWPNFLWGFEVAFP